MCGNGIWTFIIRYWTSKNNFTYLEADFIKNI